MIFFFSMITITFAIGYIYIYIFFFPWSYVEWLVTWFVNTKPITITNSQSSLSWINKHVDTLPNP